MYKIANYNPSENEQKILDTLLGFEFPYYITDSTCGYWFLSHMLMSRSDLIEANEGNINSPYFHDISVVMKNAMASAGISCDYFHRATINLSFNDKVDEVGWHTDHQYPHKVLLYYVSDSHGDTVIKIDDEIVRVKPQKNKFVVFDGEEHGNEMCLQDERRLVIVMTFKGEYEQ